MQFSSYLTVLLLIGMTWGVWWWLTTPEEHTIVHILASQEPELGLPVFAQFTAVQTVTLDSPAVIARIVVPMHFPATESQVAVDLRAEEKLLWRWRVRPAMVGTVPVDLLLPDLQIVPGQFEVQFSAAEIGHDRAHEAVRLFVEPDDSKYPGGSYRIAANQKQGDISLKLVAKRPVWQRVQGSFQQRPLSVLGRAGRYVLLGVLALALPGAVASVIRPRRAQEVGDDEG